MRLNPDCVRDILLVVEEKSDGQSIVDFSAMSRKHKQLLPYDELSLNYHFKQADLSGFLYKTQYDMAGNCYVEDLTPSGHKFLNDIRSDSNWEKTKSIAKSVGSFSLDTLKQISIGVVTELINKNFNP